MPAKKNPRKRVIDLDEGDRTLWYQVTEAAKQTDEGVMVPVVFHDGGRDVRIFDHADIEVEVILEEENDDE